jgi:hypothetical protein
MVLSDELLLNAYKVFWWLYHSKEALVYARLDQLYQQDEPSASILPIRGLVNDLALRLGQDYNAQIPP